MEGSGYSMPDGGDRQGSGRVASAGVYLLTVSSRFSSGFPFNNILLFCFCLAVLLLEKKKTWIKKHLFAKMYV